MFFEGGREVGDGGVAEHDGDFGDAEAFFVEQVAGVLHALALVEVEDGGSEHFLESFFEVTFVDGDFATKLLDGEGFADVLQEDLAGIDDLFAIGFVGEEFTLEAFDLFFADHAFQAIKQEHLALGVDEDVLEAIGIGVIQQGFQHQAGSSAKGKGFGERSRVTEFEQLFADCSFGFGDASAVARPNGHCAGELIKMHREKAEAKHVDCIDTFGTAGGRIELAGIAFDILLFAIDVAGEAKSKLQEVLSGVIFLIVIYHHAHIVEGPAGILLVAFDGILYRARDLAFFFMKRNKLVLHYRLLVSHCEYIRSLVHKAVKIH